MLAVSRRTGVFPVAVLVTNLAVPVVYHYLGLFSDCNPSRSNDRSALCWKYCCKALVAFASDAPLFSLRHYMLIFGHLFLLLFRWALR
jgi:hypothetical protein